MLRSLKLIRANPRRYLPLALRCALASPLRLLSRALAGAPLFLQEQMDIHRRSAWRDEAFRRDTGGFLPPGPFEGKVMDLEPWDTVRRDMLALLLRGIAVRGVEGELAELGVYRGVTARLFHHYFPRRTLHLFDTFEGFTAEDLAAEQSATGLRDAPGHYAGTSAQRVLALIAPAADTVRIHPGRFPASVPPGLEDAMFAFVHLDADLYEPTRAALEFFYPRTAPGGCIVVHDYNAWPGPRRAVDEFFAARPEQPVPMPDKNGSAVAIKLPEQER